MFTRTIVIFCTLAVPIFAVINTITDTKVERREAPFETYGPPPQQHQGPILPTPVYGTPAIAKYPSPPPDIPPPPPASSSINQEYGVPVLKYGPPKVHVEYGPPPVSSHSVQSPSHGFHQHQIHQSHGQSGVSFLDQIKHSLGFSGQNYASHQLSYHPHTSYGPPQPSNNHFLPPKQHTKYGVPSKPNFSIISKPQSLYGSPLSKPHTSYGPPPSGPVPPKPQAFYGAPKPQFSYGIPKPHYHQSSANLKPVYGLPLKPAINFKPQQSYGLPPGPIRPPIPAYGTPPLISQQSSSTFLHPQPLANTNIGPNLIHGAGCDGWRPIPGPSIQAQSIANSFGGSIQSNLPDNSYLPPASNSLSLADIHVQPLQNTLQLPIAEATNFNNDLGLGLTSINVIKSEGIELQNNLLDSYQAPPSDSIAPNYQRTPSFALTPPSGFYGAPSSGLGIQHGSVTGNLKQWPSNFSPPRQPIAFRPPVPQGLIESIGHSVQHQDSFGFKLQPQTTVYLPPPTGEIPPPPHGLESLPLAPAAPFNLNQPKSNHYQDVQIYSQSRYPSDCSHGPNLSGTSIITSGQSILGAGSIPQLQTVYGVPDQPLDISQSGFEIAQNSAQSNLLTSYGPPASGDVSNTDLLINTHEVHEPSSSYGPPPSGNPADSFAHSSQKSSSAIQIDSSGSSILNIDTKSDNKNNDAQVSSLPGLSGSGLDIISAQKSHTVEIPIQGQLGTYSLQFQAADPLASQNNQLETPDHQKFLSEGLLQSILTAIEQPKSQNEQQSAASENLQNHPEVSEFVNSPAGQETLAEVKAE